MKIYNKVITPALPTMNATINSTPMQLSNMIGFTIQAVWTGTPTGSFKLQASSDAVPNLAQTTAFVPTNWTDVATSAQAVSAAGNYMWNVTDVMYNYVRVVYTDTSSGTSTAIVTSLVFNGKGI